MADDAEERLPLLLSLPDSDLQLYPPRPASSDDSTSTAHDFGAGDNQDRRRNSRPLLSGRQIKKTVISTGETKPVARLTTMPTELVRAILEFLPRSNLVTLSMACRHLRMLIYGPRQPERNITDVLTLHDYVDFLHVMSKDNADQWVCKECPAIHAVNVNDTPVTPNAVNCQLALYGTIRTGQDDEQQVIQPWLSATGLHLLAYHLGYHHVQHIFRYHRLSNLTEPQKGHLKQLMAVHKQSDAFGEHSFENNSSDHEVQLKVVQQQLLALSVWSRSIEWRRIEPSQMNDVCLCPHLQINEGHPLPRRGPYLQTNDYDDSPLLQSLRMALACPGLSQGGSCFSCPIDYEVNCRDHSKAEIRAWYHLGGECAGGEDSNWRALSVDLRLGIPDYSQIASLHVPGTVRFLYESST